MAGLFLLSSIPDTDSPSSLLQQAILWVPATWQNLLHIPLYGGLALSWAWSLETTPLNRQFILLLTLGLTVGWGILDELHQATVPGRYGSLTDMGLNILGALLATYLMSRLWHANARHQNSQL